MTRIGNGSHLGTPAAAGTAAAALFFSPRTVGASSRATELVEAFSSLVYLVIGILVLLILLPLSYVAIRRFTLSVRNGPATPRDPVADAERREKKGDFAGAAALAATAGDHARAASLYEKAGIHVEAAQEHELAGDLEAAAALHLRSGASARAAALYIKSGDYLAAAKIFRNKGDHLRAAQALELFGNRTAAAREFLNAGRLDRAATLFRDEGLYEEAADTYGKYLAGLSLDAETVDRFYGYAGLLVRAGRREDAAAMYRSIVDFAGDHRKAKANLRALEQMSQRESAIESGRDAAVTRPFSAVVPAPEIDDGGTLGGPEEMQRETTLRIMIAGGNLEPRYSMRIWFHVLKAVAAKHGERIFYGSLSPDCIVIDMENQVSLLTPAVHFPTYTAPEVLAGQAPGPHSDVYILGVILYEMLTGSVEGLGSARPSERRGDVPPWLDDLVLRCTKKDRRDRYMNLDAVTAELVKLKDQNG